MYRDSSRVAQTAIKTLLIVAIILLIIILGYVTGFWNTLIEFLIPWKKLEKLVIESNSYIDATTNRLNLYISNIGKYEIKIVRIELYEAEKLIEIIDLSNMPIKIPPKSETSMSFILNNTVKQGQTYIVAVITSKGNIFRAYILAQ